MPSSVARHLIFKRGYRGLHLWNSVILRSNALGRDLYSIVPVANGACGVVRHLEFVIGIDRQASREIRIAHGRSALPVDLNPRCSGQVPGLNPPELREARIGVVHFDLVLGVVVKDVGRSDVRLAIQPESQRLVFGSAHFNQSLAFEVANNTSGLRPLRARPRRM